MFLVSYHNKHTIFDICRTNKKENMSATEDEDEIITVKTEIKDELENMDEEEIGE